MTKISGAGSKQDPPEGLAPDVLEAYRRKKAYHERQCTRYRHLVKQSKASRTIELRPEMSEQIPQGTCLPEESIISPVIASSRRQCTTIELPSKREDKERSFYKSRYFCDIELNVTRCEYKFEPRAVGGEVVGVATPDLSQVGPPGTNVTWRALAILVTMTVSYAIPAHRLAKMLTNSFKAFSSGQISRLKQRAAALCLPIYLELIDQLAEAPCLYGDDSPTRVLKMKADEDPAEGGEGLFAQVNKRLGRRALKADGSGHKKRLSISVVSGQMVAGEPRRWIFLPHPFWRSRQPPLPHSPS